MKVTRIVMTIGFCLLSLSAVAQENRDGRFYDPGITMTAPAENAVPELAKAAFLIGQWDVKVQRQTQNGTAEAGGKAAITYMNRGHSIMLRMAIPGMYGEGGDSHSIAFLCYQAAQKSWLFGICDSYREAIQLYNGVAEGGKIVLRNSERTNGTTLVNILQLTIESAGEGKAKLSYEVMNNRDREMAPTFTLNLTKREPGDDFMPVRDDFGVPAPNRVEEAKQFDFLIGEYNAHNTFIRPNGNAEFDATTTAVYVCNGMAIMEFMWYDVDKTLPDAGTTIVRIYNRATRQWESLYHANRGNGQLHFGGVQEGDRIVLHPFYTDTTRRMSMWVFHDMREEGYDWFGQSSTDRGGTWQKGWIINVRNKK